MENISLLVGILASIAAAIVAAVKALAFLNQTKISHTLLSHEEKEKYNVLQLAAVFVAFSLACYIIGFSINTSAKPFDELVKQIRNTSPVVQETTDVSCDDISASDIAGNTGVLEKEDEKTQNNAVKTLHDEKVVLSAKQGDVEVETAISVVEKSEDAKAVRSAYQVDVSDEGVWIYIGICFVIDIGCGVWLGRAIQSDCKKRNKAGKNWKIVLPTVLTGLIALVMTEINFLFSWVFVINVYLIMGIIPSLITGLCTCYAIAPFSIDYYGTVARLKLRKDEKTYYLFEMKDDYIIAGDKKCIKDCKKYYLLDAGEMDKEPLYEVK